MAAGEAARERHVSTASLLDRLDRVKQTGPHRWIARCPAHDDRSPSLSICQLDDGRTLIKCFAGCGALDILESLGLNWSALFPERERRDFAPVRTPIPAIEILEICDRELLVASLILADVLRGSAVTEAQWQRVARAAARIGHARDMVAPAKVRHHG